MRKLLPVLIALLALAAAPKEVQAVDQALRDACRQDYQTYCSAHEVGSEALRACMTDVFDKLSSECVNAILDSEAAAERAAAPKPRKHNADKTRKDKTVRAHALHKTRHAGIASRWAQRKRCARRFAASLVRRVRHMLH